MLYASCKFYANSNQARCAAIFSRRQQRSVLQIAVFYYRAYTTHMSIMRDAYYIILVL